MLEIVYNVKYLSQCCNVDNLYNVGFCNTLGTSQVTNLFSGCKRLFIACSGNADAISMQEKKFYPPPPPPPLKLEHQKYTMILMFILSALIGRENNLRLP